MNKSVVFLLTICFLLSGLSVLAQDNNLLENPGFEAPFETIDGNPPREVAQGWSPWHIPAADGSPSFANAQPEYAPTAPDSTRILAGEDAQLITSFFATHDGGVWQQVTGVTAGDNLRFSIFAYVWSTVFDELDVSEQDGDVFVQVGIDPTGSTDPESDTIVWSAAGVEQYDAYNEYEIEAEATGDTVTVFVRTTIGIPLKNNFIYLDEASLTASDEQPLPVESNTPEPPTETPVPPSETAEPPSATPEQPTATSEPPSETPVTPSSTPEPASETPIPPSETAEPASETPVPPTEDNQLELTATALIEESTTIAQTESAAANATTEAEENSMMTATAVSAQATSDAQTAVANVPSSTPDTSLEMTATAIIVDATNTASADETATAAVTPTPTETDQVPISNEFPGTISHTVRRGESVYILAELYGSTVDAIAGANGLDSNYLIQVGQTLVIPVRLPDPATSTPTPTSVVVITATPDAGPNETQPTTSNESYIVQRGDTLSRIAQRFNTNVATLAQLNGIVNINRIQAGQRLLLPGQPTNSNVNPPEPQPTPVVQTTYTVLPGDTLSRISLRFGVPISRIAQANNIVNWNRIYIGQRLNIPS